jgi:hypothetical protein
MHGVITNVEYHIGLDFEVKPSDVILIDESDQVILSNHSKFEKKIKQNRCICVTATPDNDIKFINGWPEGVPLPTSTDISCIQTLPLHPDANLI